MLRLALLLLLFPLLFSAAPARAQMAAEVFLPGVSTTMSVLSFLRFSNSDGAAHQASVMLHNGATGEMLATWTSPPIPPGGTLEASMVDILGTSDPVLRDTTLPPTLVVGISGLMGHVQHLAWSGASNAWSNLSTCGMLLMADALSLPYVSGPARPEVAGFVRLTNGTTLVRTITLTLSDNTGGVYVWLSPAIAGFGSMTVSMADISRQANPPITAARSLMVMADAQPSGVNLSYIEGSTGSTALADLTAACMLTMPVAVSPVPAPPGGVNTGHTMSAPEKEAPRQ